MLPSEKIQQIQHKNRYPDGTSIKLYEAIIMYLDEEYEKNQPCKHKSSYQVEGTEDVYYNVCNDCGVLFLGTITYQVTKK